MVLALTFATSAPLLAQQVPDPILEEERRRQLEQRTNELGTLERRGGAPDPGPAQARGGPCFQINRLTVEGVTLLSPEELAAITSKYVPRCMQGADIQAVMRELDATYADQGYITSKTYIPPQNLAAGELTLTMLEGTVEDILLIDAEQQIESKRGERQLKTAFPNAEGELFQLRDFEQGLDQMNRLASVEAILKLQPGAEPGGSYVIVQRVQEDRVRGYARLDNQGSESTGRNRLSFDLEVDDLFGANDAWTFGYSGSENTNALSINGSVPYGYWTFETELAYSEYLTPLNALSELFGTSRTAGLKARYVAHRDQTSTTELNFGLRLRKSDRFINDLRLTPQNLTTFNLGVKHLRLGEKARNSYDATLTFGTTLFGADKDAPGVGSDIPRAQFFKINAGWQRQGALGQAGTLVTDLRAQWSPHTLYGTEQLSLGSFSTVRGYEASVATGDMGLNMRNDLYLTPNIWNFLPEEIAGKVAAKTQTHLFLDMGVTHDRARDVTEKAAGFGIGLSYYHKRFTLSGTVGVPLIEGNSFGIGDPVVQIRADVKTW
ncbi:ShlB/FhaC/HecB family hemolysin secretion/activation protein [Pseudorhodobacter sp. E13]|uniref:ShlB/FhaC/HecB family hemolysin secretion/activation protein n=1 Tax=Pseudorhodobacter sp. E13 TaxID=2487931 RepID=UPI000F8DC306|nr:ShlB/FhaC/HecB family hemolysin secretion/activation protein [Pseudorhodobacter sp. E13]RUS63657.1 ShlB/FhaC/HecB family hemolysin secretion/activation protein [Pseudorhodobacter sp. E13]